MKIINLGQLISNRIDELAEKCLTAYYEGNKHYPGRIDERIRSKSLQDFKYHLHFLSEALISGQITLFLDYVSWVKTTLLGLGLEDDAILQSFQVVFDILLKDFASHEVQIRDYRRAALKQYQGHTPDEESYLETTPLPALAKAYLDALLSGDRNSAARFILKEVDSAQKVREVYIHVFQPVLKEIGRLWQSNKVSVAQEHYCTASTQLIMSQLYPFIFSTKKNGKVMVATCVGGELHEIGMRMVSDFFEMAQWDTYYLGANVPSSTIEGTISQRKANVLAISVTMTYHLELAREMIAKVRKNTGCNATKILVGGQPFNLAEDLWKKIGADGYAPGPIEAVELAESWG